MSEPVLTAQDALKWFEPLQQLAKTPRRQPRYPRHILRHRRCRHRGPGPPAHRCRRTPLGRAHRPPPRNRLRQGSLRLRRRHLRHTRSRLRHLPPVPRRRPRLGPDHRLHHPHLRPRQRLPQNDLLPRHVPQHPPLRPARHPHPPARLHNRLARATTSSWASTLSSDRPSRSRALSFALAVFAVACSFVCHPVRDLRLSLSLRSFSPACSFAVELQLQLLVNLTPERSRRGRIPVFCLCSRSTKFNNRHLDRSNGQFYRPLLD